MKKTRFMSLIMAISVCATAFPSTVMAHGAWFARRSDRIQLVCGEGWKDNAYTTKSCAISRKFCT